MFSFSSLALQFFDLFELLPQLVLHSFYAGYVLGKNRYPENRLIVFKDVEIKPQCTVTPVSRAVFRRERPFIQNLPVERVPLILIFLRRREELPGTHSCGYLHTYTSEEIVIKAAVECHEPETLWIYRPDHVGRAVYQGIEQRL